MGHKAKQEIYKTDDIVARTTDRPLHRRRTEELVNQPISSVSIWTDPSWTVDREIGIDKSGKTFDFAFQLYDGSVLTEPVHAPTLDWLRRLVWSLIVAPENGLSKLKSLGLIQQGLKPLICWMMHNNCPMPSNLDASAIDAYLEHLLTDYLDDDGDIDITTSSLTNLLNPIKWIWEQRFELQESGIAPMLMRPFEGRATSEVAKDLGAKTLGWWPPLPDEVSIPIMNRAAWFLVTPGDDIVRLNKVLVETAHDQFLSGVHKMTAHDRVKDAMDSFAFSISTGNSSPWYQLLDGGQGRCL